MRKLIVFIILLLFLIITVIVGFGYSSHSAKQLLGSANMVYTLGSVDISQNTNCLTPNCWVGILPGITKFDDARILLQQIYGRANVTVSQNGISWITEKTKADFQSGWLTTDERYVVQEINLSTPDNQLTVKTLINRFETLPVVYIVRAILSTFQCSGSILVFPDIGVIAWLGASTKRGSVGVEPDQSIQSLMLLPLERSKNWTITDSVKLKWQGYDDYCLLASTK